LRSQSLSHFRLQRQIHRFDLAVTSVSVVGGPLSSPPDSLHECSFSPSLKQSRSSSNSLVKPTSHPRSLRRIWPTASMSRNDKPARSTIPIAPGSTEQTQGRRLEMFGSSGTYRPIELPARVRTSHACDRCRELRAKCSGGTRCAKCTKDDATCLYSDRKRERNKKCVPIREARRRRLTDHSV
jgi:hypothetical protein